MTRYSLPLREGGSLPLLGAADDGFDYVIKMRGTGHGTKALIAELIGSRIAQALGLRTPEIVFVNVGEDFGRTETDPEVQDLLKQSRGLNLGIHFLKGALTLDPWANPISEKEASEIVWLDAFLTNIDRTPRNTNMLVWNNEAWLIDHGASLYFHHAMSDWGKAAQSDFAYVKDHALIHKAAHISEAESRFAPLLTDELLRQITDEIPVEWLEQSEPSMQPEELRQIYYNFLSNRVKNSSAFTNQAINEHDKRTAR